ncbi:carbohydrate-binding module family 12 protein [Suillus clintonianus]|uniref:carbohydrate-binding module family 12 protein n=1 Tax=Suillus clintonianus TaxID=1904413 RepID=UPI001B85FA0D|nr:carbohydrate-binding module family 12 protein [Suillus clintonianus]KAG2150416.1 carbohydrate-binding module family 12 protein [Suillus clintonianus]
MTDYWKPGTQYNDDTVVQYEGPFPFIFYSRAIKPSHPGVYYKIIQYHRSQSDWAPPVTPNLWRPLVDYDHRHHPHHETSGQWCGDRRSRSRSRSRSCSPPYDRPPKPPQPCRPHHEYSGQWCGDRRSRSRSRSRSCSPPCDKPPKPQPSNSPQGCIRPTHEECQKHWYDLDDKRKKELEIGGALLVGVGALAVYVHNHHGKSEEEKKAHAWSLSNWIRDAEQRTKAFRSGHYPCPVAWVLNEGKNIPSDAIEGGFERGSSLYICRAYYEGCIIVGKACSVFKKGGVIGFKKEEIHIVKYEILVGNSQAVRWVNISGQFSLASLNGLRPVEGGREPGGASHYIAQAPYHGAVHPGKACEAFGDGCFITYDSTEKKVKDYSVLCYK